MGDSCDFGPSESDMNWVSICDKKNKIISDLEEKLLELDDWINDLHSGMYINCVYCGHRYGPSDEVPSSMADVLKEHIEKCPKHPMSSLKEELDDVKIKINKSIDSLISIDSSIKSHQHLSIDSPVPYFICDQTGFDVSKIKKAIKILKDII